MRATEGQGGLFCGRCRSTSAASAPRCGFNPQPATLPAASSVGGTRARASRSPVSILSRPRCRLQAGRRGGLPSGCRFQSSAGHVAGCKVSRLRAMAREVKFQSSAGHVAGCKSSAATPPRTGRCRFQSSAGHVAGCKPAGCRSPDSRSYSFNPQPATLPAARSLYLSTVAVCEETFQSSAGHVAGCKVEGAMPR